MDRYSNDVDIEELKEETRLNELKLEKSRKKLADAMTRLEKKRKFDEFVETMCNDSCMICSQDLSDCVTSLDEGIISYQCECTTKRIVHVKCWKMAFNCVCGVTQNVPGGEDVSGEHEIIRRDSRRDIEGVITNLRDIMGYIATVTNFRQSSENTIGTIGEEESSRRVRSKIRTVKIRLRTIGRVMDRMTRSCHLALSDGNECLSRFDDV